MGDTRFRYGLAYGRMNNFTTGVAGQRGYLAGTDGLFVNGDTTPDVTNGFLFYTNNTAATTISHFDVLHPVGTGGNIAPLFEGKVIEVFFLDTNTTLAGAQLILASSDNNLTANSTIEMLYHNSAWYEINRTSIKPTSTTFNISTSSGDAQSFNANGVGPIVVLKGTSITALLRSISGGYVGQVITLITGSASILYEMNTQGNIIITSTNQVTLAQSANLLATGGFQVQKVNATQWALLDAPGL